MLQKENTTFKVGDMVKITLPKYQTYVKMSHGLQRDITDIRQYDGLFAEIRDISSATDTATLYVYGKYNHTLSFIPFQLLSKSCLAVGDTVYDNANQKYTVSSVHPDFVYAYKSLSPLRRVKLNNTEISKTPRIFEYVYQIDTNGESVSLYSKNKIDTLVTIYATSSATTHKYTITTDKMAFVTAVDPSTQAKGTAKVKKGDKFDMEIGLEIALARMYKVNLDKQIARYL